MALWRGEQLPTKESCIHSSSIFLLHVNAQNCSVAWSYHSIGVLDIECMHMSTGGPRWRFVSRRPGRQFGLLTLKRFKSAGIKRRLPLKHTDRYCIKLPGEYPILFPYLDTYHVICLKFKDLIECRRRKWGCNVGSVKLAD